MMKNGMALVLLHDAMVIHDGSTPYLYPNATCMDYLPTFGEKWLRSKGNVLVTIPVAWSIWDIKMAMPLLSPRFRCPSWNTRNVGTSGSSEFWRCPEACWCVYVVSFPIGSIYGIYSPTFGLFWVNVPSRYSSIYTQTMLLSRLR